jgi:hypothetical protein
LKTVVVQPGTWKLIRSEVIALFATLKPTPRSCEVVPLHVPLTPGDSVAVLVGDAVAVLVGDAVAVRVGGRLVAVGVAVSEDAFWTSGK